MAVRIWAGYMLGHKALQIAEDVVVLERLADGEKVFKDAFAQVHIIGDANRGGKILEATQEAYGRAFVFES